MFTPTEIAPLVERLRTDVLWHQRRGNDTIAKDCQDAADEIERLYKLLAENDSAIRALQSDLAAERERIARWLEMQHGTRDQREHAEKLAGMLRRESRGA